MKNVILFGNAGAGKDTVAWMLNDFYHAEHKREITILGLADPFNFVISYITGRPATRTEKQEVGQFFRGLFGDDVWNNFTRESVTGMYPVVIKDGRQPSEFKYWGDRGYVRIGVLADAHCRDERLEARDGYSQSERLHHETETNAAKMARKCDVIIVNNGSFDELREKVKEVYYEVLRNCP